MIARLRPLHAAGVAAHLGVAATVCVLALVGVLPQWPGLLHLVALPPLDVMADFRWLLVATPSWPWFVVGASASLLVRVTVLAALLGGVRRPRWGLATRFYLVAVVPALLVAQLDFAAHAVLYSRVFGAAVVLAAATFGVLAATPWAGAERLGEALRLSLRRGLRLPELAGYALVLLAVGAGASHAGMLATFLLVPVVAVLTLGTAAALARAQPRRPMAGLAAVVAAIVVLGSLVVVTRGEPWPDPAPAHAGSLLVMSGINSSSGEGAIFETAPHLLGYTCDQLYYFSYAGTGDGQPQGVARCPIRTGAPYEPEDTQRPFDEQVDLLEAQVAGLEPPVVVMGHSQAAWVAWRAAAEQRLPGVVAIVLIGPFPDSPVGWPPPGQDGRGRPGGDLLRVLEPLPDLVDFDFAVDAPLSHDLLARPDAARAVFERPLPDDIAGLAVPSVTDLPLMPRGWQLSGVQNACPLREAHPYLPITPAFYRAVISFLTGAESSPATCPPWPELYRLVTQPIGVPKTPQP